MEPNDITYKTMYEGSMSVADGSQPEIKENLL
jgi:hypothetical protein